MPLVPGDYLSPHIPPWDPARREGDPMHISGGLGLGKKRKSENRGPMIGACGNHHSHAVIGYETNDLSLGPLYVTCPCGVSRKSREMG